MSDQLYGGFAPRLFAGTCWNVGRFPSLLGMRPTRWICGLTTHGRLTTHEDQDEVAHILTKPFEASRCVFVPWEIPAREGAEAGPKPSKQRCERAVSLFSCW